MLTLSEMDFHKYFTQSLGEVYKTLRATVWHWVNMNGGGHIFRPNLLLVRNTLLKVPGMGISSHFRINLLATESMFSTTHVFDKLATVKCEVSFDRRWRL